MYKAGAAKWCKQQEQQSRFSASGVKYSRGCRHSYGLGTWRMRGAALGSRLPAPPHSWWCPRNTRLGGVHMAGMPVVVPRGWAAPQEQRGVLPASNTRGGAAVLWGPVPRAQPAALAPWGYATGMMAPRAPSSIPSRASRPISRNCWASWCAPHIILWPLRGPCPVLYCRGDPPWTCSLAQGGVAEMKWRPNHVDTSPLVL
jgi:hypothetical protein